MMNTVSVKVYYLENGVNKEIRRFNMDANVAGSVEYLMGKIKLVFGGLLRKDLSIYWKDEEGDYISLSLDEELIEIMNKFIGTSENLKLFIKEKSCDQSPLNNIHSGVVCDGCNQTINGIRYKCTVCPDFDFCSTCEQKEPHPSDHNMLCIKVPLKSKYFMRGCGPWRQMRTSPYGCPQFRCHKVKKEPSAAPKKDNTENKSESEDLFSFIRNSASTLGFDPDVAVSHAQSFLQSMNHCTIANESGQIGNLNDMLMAFFKQCHSDQENPECSMKNDSAEGANKESQAANDHKDKNSNQDINKNREEESKSCDLEMKDAAGSKDDTSNQDGAVPSSSKENPVPPVSPFSTQSGGNLLPDDQMKNLGQMFESIMQNIGSNLYSPNSFASNKRSDEASNPEGFVFVNDKEKKNDTAKEESFEIHLNEALQQMAAMGFDNDGDWLKQLLIAKDLDISKVLDALNPPKN